MLAPYFLLQMLWCYATLIDRTPVIPYFWISSRCMNACIDLYFKTRIRSFSVFCFLFSVLMA